MKLLRQPPLTFDQLARANRDRCVTAFHPIEEWSETDWMTAIAGEVGEAANVIKKRRRGEVIGAWEGVGYELADAVIYIDLLAQRMGMDLGELVREKFDIVSRRVGSDVILGKPFCDHLAPGVLHSHMLFDPVTTAVCGRCGEEFTCEIPEHLRG